jgi:hypothetical protein
MQSTFFPVFKLIAGHIGILGLLLSTAVCYAAYPARTMWGFLGSGSCYGPGSYDGVTYLNQGVPTALYEQPGDACSAASAYHNQAYGGSFEVLDGGGAAKCFRPDGQWWVTVGRCPVCHMELGSDGIYSIYLGYEPCSGAPICPSTHTFSFERGLCEPHSVVAASKGKSSGRRCDTASTSHPIYFSNGNKYLSESDVSSGSLGFVRSYNSLSI